MTHDLVLCISDMHHPFAHPDILPFLKAIKEKYWAKAKTPCVVIGGDEVDFHGISFHEKDPELPNAGEELKLAKQKLKYIYELFPKALVLESNHGSLVFRKQKFHGLPIEVFKQYNEFLEAPEGWVWHKDLVLEVTGKQKVYFHHGKSSDVIKLSQAMSMSAVQFHYHEKFKLEYWANPLGLYFGLQCGCLVDDDSRAMSYNKLNLKRPIIGIGAIIEGIPKLIPMVLTENGRWNKKI